MTRYAFTIALSMFTLALGASGAAAATLDFDEFEAVSYKHVGTTYSDEGYTLTSAVVSAEAHQAIGSLHTRYKGSAAMVTIYGTRLTADDGGTFTLESIDLNGLFDNPLANYEATVTFNAYDASGNLTGTYTTGDLYLPGEPWTTVEFGAGFANVAYVEWDQTASYHQFDNIVVSQGGDVTSVPELDPGAAGSGVALLLGGSAVLFDRRRRGEA